MTLNASFSFTITPCPPYDFAANANFITHYRGREGADAFDGESLTRPVDLGDCVALASIRCRVKRFTSAFSVPGIIDT